MKLCTYAVIRTKKKKKKKILFALDKALHLRYHQDSTELHIGEPFYCLTLNLEFDDDNDGLEFKRLMLQPI